MLDPSLTLELRSRPAERVMMSMRWRDLLFLHYADDPARIQALLPEGLTIDTFPDASGREMAWVGLVPFRMEGVHPRGFPRVRRCEDFPETNVRTYCHLNGRDPGVWFFSLDAANRYACMAARRWFHLNYVEARMSVERQGDELFYESRRPGNEATHNRAKCRIGSEVGAATPGTLEFFLVERYLLYAADGPRLGQGRVAHMPYHLKRVDSFEVDTGLLARNRLAEKAFSYAVFSEGVDVVGSKLIAVRP